MTANVYFNSDEFLASIRDVNNPTYKDILEQAYLEPGDGADKASVLRSSIYSVDGENAIVGPEKNVDIDFLITKEGGLVFRRKGEQGFKMFLELK